jgi:hypothetical protein
MASLPACAAGLFWLSTLAPAGPPGGTFAHRAQRKETRKEEVKAVAKAPPKVAADDDPNVQQFEQQFGPQFQQLYKMELHFMRLVCQPTKSQFEKIAADGEAARKETIRKFAVNWRGGMANDQSNPYVMIADAVAKAVRTNLSPEQAARYQKELDERAAARKRTAVLNLVVAVDRMLVLTPEQRTKLGEVLEKNWDESWNQPTLLFNLGYYFPRMPDAAIQPLLTETQKEVWRGVNKGVNFGFHLGFVQGVVIEDEVWDGDPPQEKRDGADGQGAVKGKGPTKSVEKP